MTQSGQMRVSMRATVAVARRDGWKLETLKRCMNSVPDHVVQGLLDGSAYIAKDCDETDDGSFVVYDTTMQEN